MLTLTVWKNFLVENLFKDNQFLNLAFNADEYVQGGKIVVMPQAGAVSSVTKNRSSLPATVTTRTDNDIVYVIDEYTTDPKRINNAEKYELSYDKMMSIMSEDMSAIREAVADNLIYEWLRTFAYTGAGTVPAAQVIRTTGTATAAHLSTATGNRKLFLKEDLKKAQTILNKQNVPKTERYALMSSDMLGQLMEDDDLKKRDFGKEMDLKNGSIGRLYGFDIIERSAVITYDNTGTPVVKAPGAVEATTDNDAVVCWQKNMVERAVGTIDTFTDPGNPVYYGDVFSALCRAGGRKRRLDGKGILAIVQDAAA